MTLCRITTYIGGHLYAARISAFPGAYKWVPRQGTDTLWTREEANKIAKRLRKKPLRMKIKLEAA